MFTKIKKIYSLVCLKSFELTNRHTNLSMFLIGAGLLAGGLSDLAHAVPTTNPGGLSELGAYAACSSLLHYIEGGFGALIAAGAGIGAIVASAFGGFKAAWGLVAVSVGAFILRSYITLFNRGC